MSNGFEVLQFCRMYMQAKKDCNLRYSQLCVLNILCTKPGVYTPMMLAGMLNVSRPMVAAHLKALQHAGYITRVTSPDDGRSVYVLPTKKAREVIDRTNREFDKIHSLLAEKMGEEGLNKFIDLINVANEVLVK